MLALANKMLALARAALELNKLEVAETALASTSRLAPDDPRVKQFQQDLEMARSLASTAKTAEEKAAKELALQSLLNLMPLGDTARQAVRGAKVTMLVEDGQQHLAARRYNEAARCFQDALNIAPDNPQAAEGLRKARGERR